MSLSHPALLLRRLHLEHVRYHFPEQQGDVPDSPCVGYLFLDLPACLDPSVRWRNLVRAATGSVPKNLGRGDTPDQVFLFGFAFGADGEGIQQAER